jgi:uncharacterized protein YjbI with pentapeptide repeats
LNTKICWIDFSLINRFNVSMNFIDCIISFASFFDLWMKKAKFTNSKITDTRFIRMDLIESDFGWTDLKWTIFNSSNLQKANFVKAYNYYIDPNLNKLKWARFSPYEALSLLSSYEIIIEE